MSLKIDLSGPEGNAFYLMSLVNRIGRQLGLEENKLNDIITEMKSSDYDHLVKVFAENFGVVVEIYQDGQLYNMENDE